MNIPIQIAKHLREVYFGGNWTCSNFKDNLSGISWEDACKTTESFNSIATLVYHSSYYVDAIIVVLEGNVLETKDELSFNHPPIDSEQSWEKLKESVWLKVEKAAALIELLPEQKLKEYFSAEKYGNVLRNLLGCIEHSHYHLGQIVLIKKIILK